MKKSSLCERIMQAQDDEKVYQRALKQIVNGRKTSHWIWFVFPIVRGISQSGMGISFSFKNFNEVDQYIRNQVLFNRLLKITKALLNHKQKTSASILGGIDSLKVKACMTLFKHMNDKGKIDPPQEIFKEVLDVFYMGQQQQKTLQFIEKHYYVQEVVKDTKVTCCCFKADL